MEEKIVKTSFDISFQSKQLEQLEVNICDPDDHTLKTILLSNYKSCCFSLPLSFTHCYLLLSYKNNPSNQGIELQLPSEEKRVSQKQVLYDLYEFRVRASIEPQSESTTARQNFWDIADIVEQTYAKIKINALKAVEKEGCLNKVKDFNKMLKICVRKPKGKKNLTDIFRRDKNGEIQRVFHNSSLFVEDKPIQQIKQTEEMPPQMPELHKMNTSIDKFSFGQISNEVNPPSPAVSSLHQYPTAPKYRFNKKKKVTRNEYLKTLQSKTQADIALQQKILRYIKQYEWTDIRPKEPLQSRFANKAGLCKVSSAKGKMLYMR